MKGIHVADRAAIQQAGIGICVTLLVPVLCTLYTLYVQYVLLVQLPSSPGRGCFTAVLQTHNTPDIVYKGLSASKGLCLPTDLRTTSSLLSIGANGCLGHATQQAFFEAFQAFPVDPAYTLLNI